MLTQKYDAATLNLASKADWHPFPTAQERDSWDALPDVVRQSQLMRGEVALDYDWPSLLAERFLDFSRNGNRSRYEAVHFERRGKVVDLALAECIENQGRFVDQIVNGLWLICEESYWGVPAHIRAQQAGNTLPDTAEPTVDLFAAETASLLAYTLYLLGPQLDAVSPSLRPRIEREITQRVLEPNLTRDDFYWMGFAQLDRRPNNWNPWINSNWLACVLAIEADPERRRDSVAKIMRSLDRFIDPYPADGGCDEGPSYWGRAAASLFDCLELLYKATDGQADVYGESLVQEMGRFVYRAHIASDYYINFADAPAVVSPDAALVFRYGRAIGDDAMSALGVWLAQRQNLFDPPTSPAKYRGGSAQSMLRQLSRLFSLNDMAAAEVSPALPRDAWLPVIEVMVARDQAGSTDGFYVAAKGGHNAESHNHNDIGQFVVYIDGLPVLIDAGVEVYTAKTFSDQRYDIWTMQSAYHNLPTINGVMQDPGQSFAARDASYSADDQTAQFSLDIAGAYPAEAGLKTWQRLVRLQRGQAVEVEDSYELDAAAESLTLSLVTPCQVDLSSPGSIRLSPGPVAGERLSGAATLAYEVGKFSAAVETIDIDDARMLTAWSSHLYRIVLTATRPSQQDRWSLRVTRA